MVEVTAEELTCNDDLEDCSDPLDVSGKLYRTGFEHPNFKTEFEMTQPFKSEGGKHVYYLTYALCYVTRSSKLQMKLVKHSGKHKITVSAYLQRMKDFKVNCAHKLSDPPVPREHHAACSTSDEMLWVFGGRHPVEHGNSSVHDDIMSYDQSNMRWEAVDLTTPSKPLARYGHNLFCYYNYLVMYGGVS